MTISNHAVLTHYAQIPYFLWDTWYFSKEHGEQVSAILTSNAVPVDKPKCKKLFLNVMSSTPPHDF